MFILINNSERADKFINGFVEKVKNELTIRNTEAEFYITSRLTLDTKVDLDKKINTYQPDVILIITQTESMIYGGIGFGSAKGSKAGTFDLKLFDKTPDNMIWRGKLTAYGDYGISMAINKAGDNLISKLVIDRIIAE